MNNQHTHPILRVKHLIKRFPIKKTANDAHTFFTALNKISFSLNAGEILGILGPNGAGKTTTIQILLSALKPTSGSIEYFGKNFFEHRSDILQHVSFASSYVRLPSQLSVKENLDIYAQLYGISTAERSHKIEKYLKLFGMWSVAHKETGSLSAGQMTRVMLAKAFISSPRIVLLDEPTASLDPDIAQDVRSFIVEQQKEQGVSLLVTSHNMEEVTQICNRVLVLKEGNIIADDTPQNLALSVSRARVHIFPNNHDALISFVQKNKLKYTDENNTISIDIDEHDIAQLLIQLAQHEITYSQISIDKPTLEDYFLSIARGVS